ncbi:hypothetical protein [Thalassobacillus pellis]|uniref:hypothetical protein n=1 Tax=Thalassobacillus pellis TaxID=748008 RepID=UPI001961EE75|nr:hypothetical protein [Thalassobacillus pellis]MBM7553493.1 hypothetical protein [Thalassobacillus pellis]
MQYYYYPCCPCYCNYRIQTPPIVRFPDNNQFPPVDPTLFTESAVAMQQLMTQASLVLEKLARSSVFAHKVMKAAQESNMKKVDELLKTTGIHEGIKTKINPDGINLQLSSAVKGMECCQLTIALRWRA